MDIIQLTGYIAGFILAISITPQVIKAWKTKSTKDISIIWNLMYLLGLLLFLVYGMGIKEMPIVVMGSIETLLVISLITAKIKFG
jgi:MtN3 and saliva related transmembrane protein